MKSMTTFERRMRPEYFCACDLCEAGQPERYVSDLRRRLIRGLGYLGDGGDSAGEQLGTEPPIVDKALKKAAEYLSLPLSSLFVYRLLGMYLFELEGLLDDNQIRGPSEWLHKISVAFQKPRNAMVAKMALWQPT
jgi:hypothetical protein